jgi:type VI secretion system ImpM family protein
MFERLRRPRRAPKALACYGKLPLYAEFLRCGIDSPEANWLVEWIDQAHHIMAEAETPAVAGRRLEALLTFAGGRTVLAAAIRPSVDAKGRVYPICIWATLDGRPFEACWHLAPLRLAPVWDAIGAVLDAGVDSREELAQRLAATATDPEELGAAEHRFSEATAAVINQPWSALTGTSDSTQVACSGRRFIQLAEAQAEAREGHGPAVRFPITHITTAGGELSPPIVSAAWLCLLSAASGCMRPWPAMIHVGDADKAADGTVYIFGRQPTADDLAHLLSGAGDAPIEDLSEPWDDEPTSQRGRRTLERLLDPVTVRLADLWGAGE